MLSKVLKAAIKINQVAKAVDATKGLVEKKERRGVSEFTSGAALTSGLMLVAAYSTGGLAAVIASPEEVVVFVGAVFAFFARQYGKKKA